MEISVIVNQLITLFIVIALGYFLRKVKLMPVEFNRQLTKLLLNVTMPALMVSAVLSMEERPSVKNVSLSFVAAIIMYALLPLAGFIITKLLFVSKKQAGLYIYMTTFSNVGFMGFPLLSALLGNQALLYATVINVIFNICSFSYGLLLITSGIDAEVKLTPKSFLTPGLIFSVLALVLYFLDLSFPSSVIEAVDYVGGLTTPIAMLLIGTSLANMSPGKLFTDWRIYIFTLIKQILIPVAVAPVLKMFIEDKTLLYVIFILLSVPIANASVLFATEYGADEDLAAKGVFISTLFSLFTIPLVVMWCF